MPREIAQQPSLRGKLIRCDYFVKATLKMGMLAEDVHVKASARLDASVWQRPAELAAGPLARRGAECTGSAAAVAEGLPSMLAHPEVHRMDDAFCRFQRALLCFSNLSRHPPAPQIPVLIQAAQGVNGGPGRTAAAQKPPSDLRPAQVFPSVALKLQ